MKDFKDISRIFSIARANDMEIEFNKSKCGGFLIDKGEVIVDNVQDIFDRLKLESDKLEALKEKQLPSMESSEQVTIGEFKNFLDLLDLNENMPIKLTFYHRGGKISEEGELQSIGIDKDGCLCLSTIR